MKKKNNARWIGMFVIGGLLLLFCSVVVLSSSNFFSRKSEYVMYFDSSLQGLEIGSPVSFRGVQIGRVNNIVMQITSDNGRVMTPVYVEIEPERFKLPNFSDNIPLMSEPPVDRMIKQGLHAQLQLRSLITGQMYIELEFRPDMGKPKPHGGVASDVPEIPTIPSPLAQAQESLKSLMESIRKLQLQTLVDNSAKTLETVHAAAGEFYEMMHKVNGRMDNILTNMDTASAESRNTFVEAQGTLKEMRRALDQANKMFATIDKTTGAISPKVNKSAENASVAFDELATAMRAMKELADFLERHPDSVLTGKQERKY